MPRKSFSIHSDYYSELCGMTAEQRGDVLLALIKWANDGEEPDLDPICAILFRLMKAQTEREYDRIHKRDTQAYRDWRISVFKRDKYTCQHCGKRGGKIHAHHIKRYRDNPELRTDLGNGITLCGRCHRELHRLEGC